MAVRLPTAENLGARPDIAVSDMRGIARYQPAPASQVGNAVGDLGKAGVDIAFDIQKEAKAQQQELDHVRAQDGINQATLAAQDLQYGQDGFSKVQGANVLNRPFVQDYVAKFDDAVGRIKEGMTPAQRLLVDQHLAPVRARYYGSVQTHQFQEADRYQSDTAKTTIDVESQAAAEVATNPEAFAGHVLRIKSQLNDEAARLGWPAEKAVETYHRIMSSIEMRAIDRMMGNGQDVQAGEYFDKVKGDMLPEVAKAYETTIQSAREKRESQAAAVYKQHQEQITSDLEIAVKGGKAGIGDIERAYQQQLITPQKRAELVVWKQAKDQEAAKKAAEEYGLMSRVRMALDGRSYLSPADEKDRKATDLYFNSSVLPGVAAAHKAGQIDQATQQIVDYSARAGIVPTTVKNMIYGSLRATGDDAGLARGADLLDRLKTANPQIIDDLPAHLITLGSTVNTYVRSGVPPAQAVAMARAGLAVPPEVRKEREEQYSQDKVGKDTDKFLAGQMSGWRLFSPSLPATVPPAMQAEYSNLVKQQYIMGGDLDPAKQTGLDYLKRTWGVTTTGGKPQWMRYAPETIYKVPGEDGGWIRQQLLSEIKGIASKPAFSDPAHPPAVMDPKVEWSLAADSRTAREQQPSYVVVGTKDGVITPLLGNDGRPLRFRPDYNSSPAGQARSQGVQAVKERAAEILKPKASEPDTGLLVTPMGDVAGFVPDAPRNRRAADRGPVLDHPAIGEASAARADAEQARRDLAAEREARAKAEKHLSDMRPPDEIEFIVNRDGANNVRSITAKPKRKP